MKKRKVYLYAGIVLVVIVVLYITIVVIQKQSESGVMYSSSEEAIPTPTGSGVSKRPTPDPSTEKCPSGWTECNKKNGNVYTCCQTGGEWCSEGSIWSSCESCCKPKWSCVGEIGDYPTSEADCTSAGAECEWDTANC